MTLKELLEAAQGQDGTLTIESIESAIAENKVKFVDINEGKYVSINKYNADLKAKDIEINGLNETLSTRDNDLQTLQTQLQEAGTDAEKLSTLSTDLSTLQTKYDNDTKALQDQLAKQGYEFAVREFASTKNFSSGAAKRDFINSMIAENLKMSKDGKSIMGAEDFVNSYMEDNQDAFMTEEDFGDPSMEQLPMFVNPTQGTVDPTPDPTGGFANAFHFTTVRPMPE